MKKSLLFASFFLLALYGFSQPALGLRVGEPYGLNLKLYASENSAVDIVPGGNYLKKTFTYDTDGIDYAIPAIMVNYVYQKPLNRRSDGEFYIGAGGTYQRVKFLGSTAAEQGPYESRLIFNVPIGLEYFFGGSSFSLYGEFKPAIEIVPGFGALYLDPAVGFRIRFD